MSVSGISLHFFSNCDSTENVTETKIEFTFQHIGRSVWKKNRTINYTNEKWRKREKNIESSIAQRWEKEREKKQQHQRRQTEQKDSERREELRPQALHTAEKLV